MSDTGSGSEDDDVSHIVTVDEMLQAGLKLFYSQARINRAKQNNTNIGRLSFQVAFTDRNR